MKALRTTSCPSTVRNRAAESTLDLTGTTTTRAALKRLTARTPIATATGAVPPRATIMMRVVLHACCFLALVSCSRADTIYRDTWQPINARDAAGKRRLLVAALRVDPKDLGALREAGAAIIGYHAARKGWALRAGSTGAYSDGPDRSVRRHPISESGGPDRWIGAERRGMVDVVSVCWP
jgi:hypothetical protein